MQVEQNFTLFTKLPSELQATVMSFAANPALDLVSHQTRELNKNTTKEIWKQVVEKFEKLSDPNYEIKCIYLGMVREINTASSMNQPVNYNDYLNRLEQQMIDRFDDSTKAHFREKYKNDISTVRFVHIAEFKIEGGPMMLRGKINIPEFDDLNKRFSKLKI